MLASKAGHIDLTPARGRARVANGMVAPTNNRQLEKHPFVPKKYAGQWIAWSSDQRSIIASGSTLREVEAAAQAIGESDPAFEWVPPANRRIVGAGW